MYHFLTIFVKFALLTAAVNQGELLDITSSATIVDSFEKTKNDVGFEESKESGLYISRQTLWLREGAQSWNRKKLADFADLFKCFIYHNIEIQSKLVSAIYVLLRMYRLDDLCEPAKILSKPGDNAHLLNYGFIATVVAKITVTGRKEVGYEQKERRRGREKKVVIVLCGAIFVALDDISGAFLTEPTKEDAKLFRRHRTNCC